MSAAICVRCGETLRDSSRPCGFCASERRRAAVTVLVSAAGNRSDAALFQRANAIFSLRGMGYSEAQVLEARAKALDGYSVDQILEGLEEVERVGAAA